MHRTSQIRVHTRVHTALWWASNNRNIDVVRELVKYADLEKAQLGDGRTPLIQAAYMGDRHIEVVQVLLEAGANVHAKVKDGRTALEIAKEYECCKQVVPILEVRLSAILRVAQLRLYLAYACHERVGSDSLMWCLPPEVIELIGQQMTVHVVLHGLVCRPALLSEGVPPE